MSAKTPVEKKPIRDLLQEKDAFLTTSEKFFEYFLRHTKAFISVGVALVLIIIGTALYIRHQNIAEARASEAYENALALVGAPDGAKAAVTAMENLRNEHQGRKAARLAGFSLIYLYEDAGESDKALSMAQGMLQTLQPAEISLKPMLLSSIGGLSEVKGDYQLASTSYGAILTLPDLAPALKMESLMGLARSQAAAGNSEEAVKAYESVVREFPQSMNAFIANFKVAEIKGEAVALFPGAASEMRPPTGDDVTEGGSEGSAAAEEGVPAEGQPAAKEDAAPAEEQPVVDEKTSAEDYSDTNKAD